MKTKFSLSASVVMMLAFVFVLGTVTAQPAFPCESEYVQVRGKVIRLSPTGADDTATIQCAFDWASSTGPDMMIRMQPGTFHTGQIVVHDYFR